MSKKQFVVIGLGNTGYFLATHLTELGHDVMVVDPSPEKIQDISNQVAQAVVADGTRLNQLKSLPLSKVDAVISCIGEDLQASLLTILNLKELNVKRIISKSSSLAHTTILKNLGISEIFQPERDMAYFQAERLNRSNMLDVLPFEDGFSIVEFACPPSFLGKNLKDLNLTHKFGVQVIAIKVGEQKNLKIGNIADYIFEEGDVLYIIGSDEALDKFKG